MSNDTYTISQLVRYGHGLTNTDYSPTPLYFNKVISAPFAIFVIGIVSLLGLCVGLFLRCLKVESFKCNPTVIIHSDGAVNLKALHRDRNINSGWLYILLILVCIFNAIFLYGNSLVDSGTNTVNRAVTSGRGNFRTVSSYATTLVSTGNQLQSYYVTANKTCTATGRLNQIEKYIKNFQSSSDNLQSTSNAVTDQFEGVTENIKLYFNIYRIIAVYSLFSLTVISCLTYLFGFYYKQERFMHGAVAFSLSLYSLMILFGFCWTLLTSGTADICMKPSYNVIQSIPNKQPQVIEVANYFSTCRGNNTLGQNSHAANNDAININKELNLILQSPAVKGKTCPNNPSLTSMQSLIATVGPNFVAINQSIVCPPLQDLWLHAINTGLCEEMYPGVFYIWGSQIFASFSLFWLAVCGSITYKYFNLDMVIDFHSRYVRARAMEEGDENVPSAEVSIIPPMTTGHQNEGDGSTRYRDESRRNRQMPQNRRRQSSTRSGEEYGSIPDAGVAMFVDEDGQFLEDTMIDENTNVNAAGTSSRQMPVRSSQIQMVNHPLTASQYAI